MIRIATAQDLGHAVQAARKQLDFKPWMNWPRRPKNSRWDTRSSGHLCPMNGGGDAVLVRAAAEHLPQLASIRTINKILAHQFQAYD
jgi:hypothetical protein